MLAEKYQHIVFYDSTCLLCDRSIRRLMRLDRNNKLYFCALQSPISKQYLDFNVSEVNSIIYWSEGSYYLKSEAIVQILRTIAVPRIIPYTMSKIPLEWRDRVYSYIAKNRFKWFGKVDNCTIPTASERAKIIG